MRISPFLMLFLLINLSGCSALMPTREIASKDAVGEYPAIGAVPQAEAPALTQAERDKMTKELEAARAKNKRAAATPISQQVKQ